MVLKAGLGLEMRISEKEHLWHKASSVFLSLTKAVAAETCRG